MGAIGSLGLSVMDITLSRANNCVVLQLSDLITLSSPAQRAPVRPVPAMGARSAEALAKRAAKRNMTVEEYCKAEKRKGTTGDAASIAEKRQAAGDRQAVAGAKRARADAPRPRHGDWTCTACQYQNFASRDECKQCGAEAPNKEERARVQAAVKAAKQKTSDPARAWAESVGKNTQEHIDENRRLRDAYKKDKTTLTEEERTRAEALLARDERKKQKKQQRSAPGGGAAARYNRDAWRELRRQQAAARPPRSA